MTPFAVSSLIRIVITFLTYHCSFFIFSACQAPFTILFRSDADAEAITTTANRGKIQGTVEQILAKLLSILYSDVLNDIINLKLG